MTDAQQIELAEARSACYRFFSRVFMEEPTKALMEGLLLAAAASLKELFPDPAYQREFAGLRLDFRQGNLTLEGAVLDFEALFRVPGPRYLSPFESVYRSQKARGRGCLCGPETMAVEALYLQEGLGPGEGFSELPDHVGVELEFMAFLCRQAAAAMKAGDRAALEEYQRKQQYFFRDHLGAWGRLLADHLASQAQTSLYRFLGNFLNLFLELEDNLICRPEDDWPVVKPADASLGQGVRQ
jgi:TorA maturation chaperone TorD